VSNNSDDRAIDGASGGRSSAPLVHRPIHAAVAVIVRERYCFRDLGSWPEASLPITAIFPLGQVVMDIAKRYQSEPSTHDTNFGSS